MENLNLAINEECEIVKLDESVQNINELKKESYENLKLAFSIICTKYNNYKYIIPHEKSKLIKFSKLELWLEKLFTKNLQGA